MKTKVAGLSANTTNRLRRATGVQQKLGQMGTIGKTVATFNLPADEALTVVQTICDEIFSVYGQGDLDRKGLLPLRDKLKAYVLRDSEFETPEKAELAAKLAASVSEIDDEQAEVSEHHARIVKAIMALYRGAADSSWQEADDLREALGFEPWPEQTPDADVQGKLEELLP